MVVLRRLADALADGDRIYAVIRGWSVNNDGGRKVGFTAPGVQGQAAVIAEALASADLTAADIDYVEAHGTGTALGDASEIAALQQVFRGEQCLIGSIKTNLGHLDRAAGVTGLIKTSLALRNGEIPATRNLTEQNPQLRAGEAQLEVVTSLHSWPRSADRARRAGVSAFGIGGTNAHVVLEEAPVVSRPAADGPELLVWSARSAAAADELTELLAAHLVESDGQLADVAHTLQLGRRAFEHRRMLVANSPAEAAAGLRAGGPGTGTAGAGRIGLLIPGVAGAYPRVAADRYATEPVYRAAVEECSAIARDQGIAEDAIPAGFVADHALVRLLASWGIEPAVVSWHGAGGCLAAQLAGLLSLSDALALAHRLSTGAEVSGWLNGRLRSVEPAVELIDPSGQPIATGRATEPANWAAWLTAPAAAELTDCTVLSLGSADGLGLLPAGDEPAEAARLLAEAVGRLWLTGAPVDWAGYRAGRVAGKVGLPGYPFQRQRYWIAAPTTPAAKAASAAKPELAQGQDDHVQLLRPAWSPAPAAPEAADGGYLLIGDSGRARRPAGRGAAGGRRRGGGAGRRPAAAGRRQHHGAGSAAAGPAVRAC